MFTITFRVTKKQLAAAAAALVLAFAGGLWAKSALSELAGDVAQAPAEVKIEKTAAKTNEQRVSFWSHSAGRSSRRRRRFLTC